MTRDVGVVSSHLSTNKSGTITEVKTKTYLKVVPRIDVTSCLWIDLEERSAPNRKTKNATMNVPITKPRIKTSTCWRMLDVRGKEERTIDAQIAVSRETVRFSSRTN